MTVLVDIQINDGANQNFAIASFRIDQFPLVTLFLQVHKAPAIGRSLDISHPADAITSIFLLARWVDCRGGLFEEDSLFPCLKDLGHARSTLCSLLMSPDFHGNLIQPLMRAVRDQMTGRLRVRAVNAPLPERLPPPARGATRG